MRTRTSHRGSIAQSNVELTNGTRSYVTDDGGLSRQMTRPTLAVGKSAVQNAHPSHTSWFAKKPDLEMEG